MGARIIGGKLPSVAYTATAWTSYGGLLGNTFAGLSIGTAAPRRRIVVCAMCVNNTITNVTVGGASCTVLGSTFNPNFWITNTPITTGTTADVVITVETTAASTNVSVTVWAVYDLRQVTAVDHATSTANPGVLDLDTLAHGIVLVDAMSISAVTTFTWTGATQDYAAGASSFNTPRAAASASGVVAAAPRTVRVSYSSATSPRSAAISLR